MLPCEGDFFLFMKLLSINIHVFWPSAVPLDQYIDRDFGVLCHYNVVLEIEVIIGCIVTISIN